MSNIQVFNRSQGFNVSNRYRPINTETIVNRLIDQGFEVTKVRHARTKSLERQGYQRHVVTMRHKSLDFKIDGIVPELIISNSYDASSAFSIRLGVFRVVCSNGLISGVMVAGNSRIVHVGNALDKVLVAMNEIESKVASTAKVIQAMQATQLNDEQLISYSNEAMALVIPDTGFAANTSSLDLIKTRRIEDNGTDLFTIFNRIQENITRYGIRYMSTSQLNGTASIRTTRRIASVIRDLDLNVALWKLTETYINKTGA